MSKIHDIDIGTVSLVEPIHTQQFVKKQLASTIGSHYQNMLASTKTWRITGFMDSLTQAKIEDLEALRDAGLVVFIDISEPSPKLFGFGKIETLTLPREEEKADMTEYEIVIQEVIGVGTVYMQTSEAFVLDRAYHLLRKWLNPLWAKCNVAINANRDEFQFEFYVNNDKAELQTVWLEIQVPYTMNSGHFKLEYWNGSAFAEIGDWGTGGSDAWDDIELFTDPDAQGHNVRVSNGNRGEAVAAGTISKTLGLKRRILIRITNMQIDDADSKTVYGGDQVLLRATIYRGWVTSDDLHYVDGSVDHGRPNP